MRTNVPADASAAFEAVTVGIVVMSPGRVVSSLNPAAAALLECDTSDAVGKPLDLLTGTRTEPAEIAVGKRNLRIIETITSDGQSVVEIHDISHERGLGTASTMFLASTSHELKTPLTAITGFARWLQDHPYQTKQQTDAVDAIVTSVDELSGLVEKILLGARTEITAGDLDIEPTNLVPLLTAIANQFAVPGSEHPLLIEVEDPNLAIMCDRRAMRTAIGQLIENAIKYSPDGGSIRLGASQTDSGRIDVTVTDQGIGIDPADAEYLFIAFYQGDRPTKEGVGLGLSIVRRLIEAQDGTVNATGTPGLGATFSMTLPSAA